MHQVMHQSIVTTAPRSGGIKGITREMGGYLPSRWPRSAERMRWFWFCAENSGGMGLTSGCRGFGVDLTSRLSSVSTQDRDLPRISWTESQSLRNSQDLGWGRGWLQFNGAWLRLLVKTTSCFDIIIQIYYTTGSMEYKTSVHNFKTYIL